MQTACVVPLPHWPIWRGTISTGRLFMAPRVPLPYIRPSSKVINRFPLRFYEHATGLFLTIFNLRSCASFSANQSSQFPFLQLPPGSSKNRACLNGYFSFSRHFTLFYFSFFEALFIHLSVLPQPSYNHPELFLPPGFSDPSALEVPSPPPRISIRYSLAACFRYEICPRTSFFSTPPFSCIVCPISSKFCRPLNRSSLLFTLFFFLRESCPSKRSNTSFYVHPLLGRLLEIFLFHQLRVPFPLTLYFDYLTFLDVTAVCPR